MVGFRYNPILRQSLIVSGRTPQNDQSGIVVSGLGIILVLDLLVRGRIRLHVQDDYAWMMLASELNTLTSAGGFEGLHAATLKCRAQHLTSVFRLINDQNPAGRGGRLSGKHRRTSVCVLVGSLGRITSRQS